MTWYSSAGIDRLIPYLNSIFNTEWSVSTLYLQCSQVDNMDEIMYLYFPIDLWLQFDSTNNGVSISLHDFEKVLQFLERDNYIPESIDFTYTQVLTVSKHLHLLKYHKLTREGFQCTSDLHWTMQKIRSIPIDLESQLVNQVIPLELIPIFFNHFHDSFPLYYPTKEFVLRKLINILADMTDQLWIPDHNWSYIMCRQNLQEVLIKILPVVPILKRIDYAFRAKGTTIMFMLENGPQVYQALWNQHVLEPITSQLQNVIPIKELSQLITEYIHS